MGKGEETNAVTFFVNGERYTINPETEKFDLDTPLVDYIRDTIGLKGTKFMCREGGCGACVVSAKVKDPATGQEVTKAVNSCLTPVLSCNGWDITTVERLGNRKDGYHKIQDRLAKFNGTQCGYCSPGMVMSMYSLMNSKDKVTVQDVHDSFDGNICRCTGYRPILDAFKSFAVDAPEDIRQKAKELEGCAGCPGGGGCCKQQSTSKATQNTTPVDIKLPTSGQEWVQPTDLKSAIGTLGRFSSEGKKYRVVAGNTGTGVFKHDGPYDAFLDINNIPDFKKSTLDASGVVLGAGTTLTCAIKLLLDASKLPGYEYTAGMSHHWERVANVPVRNNATIAGNLMMKHAHHDFPSDVFLILETVGAEINIAEGHAGPLKSIMCAVHTKRHSVLDFLKMDMTGKLIVSIHLPAWKGDYRFRSFKITRRYQNAHAYVNAGFLIKVDPAQNFKVLEQPRILFGGIHSKFAHASATEAFLNGKALGDQKTLEGAMEAMDREIQPDYVPPDAKPEYRKILAKGLLYKTILNIIEPKVSGNLKSGGIDIKREISKGKQTHEIDTEDDLALYKNVTKIEAGVQASGEAEYVNDIPLRPGELQGAFVLSTVANADIVSVDASEALKMPGVVAFVSEKDVPGANNFMTYNFFPFPADEKIFAKDRVHHAGQSIGVILATTHAIAAAAAKKVKVTYANQQQQLVLDIAESLKKAEATGTLAQQISITNTSKTPPPAQPSKHMIKGQFTIGAQYHFHMETQSCVCVPKEDGMDVFSATQWMDHAQIAIAEALGVPTNNINVEVRRLGGSFGGKITKASLLATACAVAANAVNKPVRLNLDMETNMRMMGKRDPYLARYEVGVDDNGKIESLKMEIYCDPGYSMTEAESFFGAGSVQNVYAANGWELKTGFLLTDTASNTSCRAPGTTQQCASMEYVMEHIAHVLGKDPFEVRAVNFMKPGDAIVTSGKELKENLALRMIDELKASGDYENRKKAVEAFNKENRWKKRGLSLIPVRYELDYFNMVKFPATVIAHHRDGYVSVSTGGIEMGQGLNTKVAQTVAHMLQIPLEKIKVRPSNTFVGVNSFVTGGSFGSEISCAAAKQACQILLDRMAPIKEKLEDKSWDNVVKASYDAHLDLSASYLYGPNDKYEEYYIWVVNLSEVEVDMLTGEFKVTRVDIIEDAGKSLSPGIDIGQVEGAYLMGQGLWTMEKIVYDQKTGELLTNSTWEYKPPESKDVPEDFRITLLANAPNPHGIMRSKASGEPPLVSSVAVFLAIKQAIDSARRDAGNTEWYQMDGPITPEDIVRLALTSSNQFKY